MKTYLAFILAFYSILSPLSSQQKKILHIVDKSNISAIPYATISNLEKSQGIYANENGIFDLLSKEIIKFDTLIISAVGYIDKKVLVNDIYSKDTILLTVSDVTLNQVVVTPSDATIKETNGYFIGVLQKKNEGVLRKCDSKYGGEYAVRMEKYNTDDEINKIFVYLEASKGNTAPFRIKIYNERNGLPSTLLHSMIVKPKRKLKRWKSIPVNNITVTQNEKVFYVAFEWLETNKKKYANKIGNDIGNEIKIGSCFGQLVGTIRSQNEQLTYIKASLGAQWYSSDEFRDVVTGKPVKSFFLPMIKVMMK